MARGRGCTRLPFACASFEPAAAIVNVATTLTSASGRQREIRAPILPPPIPRSIANRAGGVNRKFAALAVIGMPQSRGKWLRLAVVWALHQPRRELGLPLPRLRRRGGEGGEHKRSILLGAPSLFLPRKRGRGRCGATRRTRYISARRANHGRNAMRMIDLSREVYHPTPTYPGQPPIIHGIWKTHEESFVESGNVQGNCVMFFSMPDHGGTHIDAPRHFGKTGIPIDEYPLEH